MLGFFDRKVCLTHDPLEWAKAHAEFMRVGLTVDKFDALPIGGNILGPHQSFSASVRKMLTEFLESDNQRLLHLEDDVIFRDNSPVDTALAELPEDWDIVYLGANLILWQGIDSNPRRYSEHLFRIDHAWTTHAVGYNKKVIPFLLEHQPDINAQMFDNWMSEQLINLNAFIVCPMAAWQRPRFSSIWGRHDDYTPIFRQSEAMLK